MHITRLFIPLYLSVLILGGIINAKDFSVRIANARMVRNPPASASDFNIIFDIDLRSEIKEGVFANVSSIGGCHFRDVEFLYNDGREQAKIGAKAILPLSYTETETFVYEAGDKPQIYTYKKVATICTDLLMEMEHFKLLRDSEVKTFKGVIYMSLTVFSVKNSKFVPYDVEVGFQANRLPTGNMMDFSMEVISITEITK